MSDTLLIHYNVEQKDHASWALCNDAGELTSKISTGSLADLHTISSNHISIVLLNSQCLHINELQLPTQNMQKMLKAVPYAIEEFIADDIENFHFVVAKAKTATSTNNTTSVIGIDKTTLQAVINQFQQANIFIEKIIPDALCLAANEQQWAALNFEGHSYLQTNKLSGMMVPHDVLPYILDSKLNDENIDKPEKLLLFCEAENTSVFESVALDNTTVERINITYNTHPLVVFCGNYKQALALNLLQHDFKPKSKSSGYWKHWRLAITLAASWLLLHIGVTAFQHNQLKEENLVTKNKIEKIYKTAFPKSRKINNPRRQMEQKLKELKNASGNATNGLLFMLEESFSGLNQETKDINFKSFTFRNNRLDIGLESKNLQATETLNKKLNTSKTIKSEITASSSEKNIVKGNLRVEARH
jgi:general secretion pathway protein L